jgi:alpha-maltose-1-phosphate synthase
VKVAQICVGRFHHFDLARQLVRHGVLERFFSGYPPWRMAREGIPRQNAACFAWLWAPYLVLDKTGRQFAALQRELFWQAHDTLDRFAARRLPEADCLIAFSGCGLQAGRAAASRGMRYVCDEAGSHIAYRNRVLSEEYRHYGSRFPGIHPHLLQRELDEYETADIITVPSDFVAGTFIEMGVPAHRLRKVPYGVDLRRFGKTCEPGGDSFDLLFVGEVSVRKGFRHVLDAFARLKHPAKRLTVVGHMTQAVRAYLHRNPPPENARFLGHVPQGDLKHLFSRAHALLLPSIEEGLALVQGQALACGCPVVASWNTGASDLFTDGVEGFIVPSGDVAAMADRLQRLADDPALRARMSEAALARVATLGGADRYGDCMVSVLAGL